MATHEVRVLCNCDDVENCRMELYVSDVRILEAELRQLKAEVEQGCRLNLNQL